MSDKQTIRNLYFRQGMTVSAISRQLNFDPRTVTKIIDQEDWNTPAPRKRAPVPSILDPYKPTIDAWLEADRQARRKQRHTARRVYDRLRKEMNCTASYRTIAAYVTQKRQELFGNQAAFIPLEHPVGEAQVDFGEADMRERGVLKTGFYLNVSYPQSNGGYFQLFYGQNLECVMEGLLTIFSHVGGVATKLWFDNLKPVVSKILRGGERNLTERFARFQEHHRFDALFCNPNSGHEKGNVEGKVGYHRRNALVPIPEFDDLAAFNRQLLEWGDEDQQRQHYRKDATIGELFAADRQAFLPLSATPFDTGRYETVRTDGYGKFTIDGKYTYSTSPQYVRSEVFVRLSAFDVRITDRDGKFIVSHARLYGERRQEAMDWLPYLTQLSRRPGAYKYSGIPALLPPSLQEFLSACDRSRRKETLQVLAQITEQTDFPTATAALLEALNRGADDADSIIALFRRMTEFPLDFSCFALPDSIPAQRELQPDLAVYSSFLPQGGEKH